MENCRNIWGEACLLTVLSVGFVNDLTADQLNNIAYALNARFSGEITLAKTHLICRMAYPATEPEPVSLHEREFFGQ